MCGIAGFWHLRSGRPAKLNTLRRMISTLIHRGPDEEGFHLDGPVGLGIRRLRVIDPAGGSQPMTNEDGSVHVVFNGEIYNHGELRRELQDRGHRFRTDSDTEVLVHGWEEWAEDLPQRLNGMFALALYDRRRGRMFLARDRLGIKPLYLFEGREGIVFGSELKAVMASGLVPLKWNLEAVDDFLTYEYVPTPSTVVQGVEKLRAGSRVALDRDRPGTREESHFWRLEAGMGDPAEVRAALASPRAGAEALRSRLDDAVRLRMEADVPLGAFLSGGIDSSSIVALMQGHLGGHLRQPGPPGASHEGSPLRTFALGFAEPSWDERPWARLVADHVGTWHREGEVGPEISELAGDLAGLFDEPFADVSAFPTFLLSKLARTEVTVALSGDGGDELFAGYDCYRAHQWQRRLRWLGGRWGWQFADRLLTRIPPSPRKKGPVNLAKRFAEGAARPSDLEHARWWVFWDLSQRRALIAGELAEALRGRDCFAHYRGLLDQARDRGFAGLAARLHSDLSGYLPDDILTKVDRMSMAVSLEARVPFLDHRFVEFAMALPDAWKLGARQPKWILREAMRGLLPPETIRKGKEGFSIPMKNWLRGPLRPLMDDLLEGVLQRGWFDGREGAVLRRQHLNGLHNHAHRLWCLMSLELSLRHLERGAASGWSTFCTRDADTSESLSPDPTP